MANNTSNICNFDKSTIILRDQLSFAAYIAITPIYFLVGLISHVFCLITFYKHYKKEKAFAYQFFVSFSQLLVVIMVSSSNTMLMNLSGYRLPGSLWFQQSYYLMRAAYLASSLYNGFLTVSLLMSVSLAADRLFAIMKPFVYNKIKKGHHQAFAVALCFLLACPPAFSTRFVIKSVKRAIDT